MGWCYSLHKHKLVTQATYATRRGSLLTNYIHTYVHIYTTRTHALTLSKALDIPPPTVPKRTIVNADTYNDGDPIKNILEILRVYFFYFFFYFPKILKTIRFSMCEILFTVLLMTSVGLNFIYKYKSNEKNLMNQSSQKSRYFQGKSIYYLKIHLHIFIIY